MKALLLDAPVLDAAGHMALDEAALELAPPGSLALRFYRWERPASAPAAATFGYFQRYEDAAREARARGYAPIFPLVRRPTGGGIVFHDGDITFSLVFPWDRLTAADCVYKDLHWSVHLGLKTRGLASRLWSPARKDGAAPLSCFSVPSPMDLVHEDGTKFLGGALRRRGGKGLYQASLRPEGFRVPEGPAPGGPVRAGTGGGGIDIQRLREAVLEGVGLSWKALFTPQAVPVPIAETAERLRKERYSRDDWNRRR